ncbi:MAG: MBL fold metallo-hydrolase [Ruminococcus sp.]|jgi:beta-lactamase superfamily II metal-dependent hydrolase|nr:MBL fold metallo-hydrolase [Ruminococcus sp.]
MAGQSKRPRRKPAGRQGKTQTGKTGGKLSLPLIIILLLIIAGLILSAYYELRGDDTSFAEKEPTVISGEKLAVHFIDVGQGDSELIVYGKKAMLIDAGEAEYGNTVVSYLQNLGITKLEYIIATHPHSDHIGGLAAVIANFDVGKIITPKLPEEMTPTTRVYENFIEQTADKGYKLTAAKAGDKFNLGDAEFTVLSPDKNADFSDLNDYSVVIRLVYKNSSWLFTGDAEKPAEDAMVASGQYLHADILKVGHHGSANSSTDEFLAAVEPRWAVIEVGAGNSYNHPTDEALARIERYAKIFRTDTLGTIIFETDGDVITRVDNRSD